MFKNYQNQVVEKWRSVWGLAETNARKLYDWTITDQRITQGIEKTKDFYANHQQACIGTGFLLAAALFLRRQVKRNRQQAKQQPPAEKIDRSQTTMEEQTKTLAEGAVRTLSTTSNEKEQNQVLDEEARESNSKQRQMRDFDLDLGNPESEDESEQDRIFFQMFQKYKETDE